MLMVRYQDSSWINGGGVYFWIIKDINDTLIELLGLDENNPEVIEPLFYKLTVEISRIFPIYIVRDTNALKISRNDGILGLKRHFGFLMSDYNDIFKSYKDLLRNIHDVRNKFEHIPHLICWKEYVANNKNKTMVFVNEKYDPIKISMLSVEEKKKIENGTIKTKWIIDTSEIRKLIIDLNNVFKKIQTQYLEYFKNNRVAMDHPYIHNILSIDFNEYYKKLNIID